MVERKADKLLILFFSDEFQADADGVYVDLGSPTIILESAWDIFSMVVAALEQLPQYA